jgi:hypothetical protein
MVLTKARDRPECYSQLIQLRIGLGLTCRGGNFVRRSDTVASALQPNACKLVRKLMDGRD